MERLKDPKVQGALRHALTALGPLIAASGITTDALWQIVVGIVMAFIGFYTSWTAKEKKPE